MTQEDLPIRERYELLRVRLAYYLLLQVHTFLKSSGKGDLSSAMKALIDKTAEIKIARAKNLGDSNYVESLSTDLATNMGAAFDSNYHTEKDSNQTEVTLTECGCITDVVKLGPKFGLDASECRSIFCGSCMGGYKAASEKLDVTFDGNLTKS